MVVNPLIVRLLPYAAVLLLAGFAVYKLWQSAYTYGQLDARQQCSEEVAQLRESHANALQLAREDYARQQAAAVAETERYWQANRRIETVTETIEKEVIRYVREEAVSNNVCEFNDDFLLIWNAANNNEYRDPNQSGAN